MLSKKRLKRKRNFLSFFLKLVLGVIFLTIILFLINQNLKIYQKREKLAKIIGDLSQKINLLEEENQKLKTEIERVHSIEYLEEIAFEKFNLKPRGAEVGIVIPQEETENREIPKEKNFWQKILEKLKLGF